MSNFVITWALPFQQNTDALSKKLKMHALLIWFAFHPSYMESLIKERKKTRVLWKLHKYKISSFYCRFYRLHPQPKFGNLFSVNNGCPYLQAGIGNISFVKDLSTQSVLTKNLKCSKFGPHTHDMLGWVYS
jgi:hypothetical protein